ncbi:MBOAT-domain-containing protein [Peniophora sp. CONT]|nr:MBOAT-domain-containing protein [Peniophora sp. CONT]
MDALFQPAADALGAPVEQLKLIFCLLVSYPLGSVFVRIPGRTLKHVFTLVIAGTYLIPLLNLRTGTLELLGDVLVTYFLARGMKNRKNMPWIVFWVNMAHLTYNHVMRVVMHKENEPFDITACQMVLVMKLTTFAWNVYDAARPEEELDSWQNKMAVREYPSILEFLGYAFYFPGILVGPYLEYKAYMSLVDGSLFRIPAEPVTSTTSSPAISRASSSASLSVSRRDIPDGRKRVAYGKGLLGLVFLITFVIMHGSLNASLMLQPWFLRKPFWFRIGYMQACQFIERTKYYGIWTLTEGAAILTGFGFTGYTPSGKSIWHGAANLDVVNVEFAPNFKVLLDSWNMKTNTWLRECIYKRVTPKGKKPGFMSSMLTFGTSAFWHGIAPGYYMSFLYGGFVQTAGRLARGSIRPLVLPVPNASTTSDSSKKPAAPPTTALKRTYDIVGMLVTALILNFASVPFILLNMHDCLEAWRRVNWYGIWIIGGAFAFFYGGGRAWLKRVQTLRIKKAAGVVPPQSAKKQGEEYPQMQVPPVDVGMKEVEKKLPVL